MIPLSRLQKGILFFVLIYVGGWFVEYFFVHGFGNDLYFSLETKEKILTSLVLSLFPVAVYYIATCDRDWRRLKKHPAYKNLTDREIQFIDGFSWGAYLGSMLWPLVHMNGWFFLRFWIPVYNIYWHYKQAIDGRKMIWESNPRNFRWFWIRELAFETLWVIVLSSTGVWIIF